MVEQLNQSIPQHLRHLRVSLEAREVEQMYTNISLTLLKTAMRKTLKAAFQHLLQNPKDPDHILKYILVSSVKGESTLCDTIPSTGNVTHDPITGTLKKSSFSHCITEDILNDWIDYLIDNIYISIGVGIVLKQIIGLPMGIQPAVFFANCFMFYYELDFARRVMAVKRFDIIAHFRFTGRFVDDIVALQNPILSSFISRNVTFEGIHGIYPDCITITIEQQSYISLDHLDIHIYKYDNTWQTNIYNKKHHKPLN
jgi:hypothetical protein